MSHAAIPLLRIMCRDEGGKVKQVPRKGAFSAYTLRNICGTRLGNCEVVLKALKAKLALEAAKVTSQSANKEDKKNRLSRILRLLIQT